MNKELKNLNLPNLPNKPPPPRWPKDEPGKHLGWCAKALLRGEGIGERIPQAVERMNLGYLLLIILLLTALSPFPTLAARERIRVKQPVRTGGVRRSTFGGAYSTAKLRSDRKALLLNLSNMENAGSVSYQLTYTANGVSQGVMGSIDPTIEPTAFRELLFGTCSSSVCTYHTNITNMRLTISSHLKSGPTVVKPYRIRP